MSNTTSILINGTHVVKNSNNCIYKYNFSNPITLRNKAISLSSISIYYSWFNIGAAYNNNIFTYKWWNNSSTTLADTFTITIDDGNYSIETLNAYLELKMKKNGHYVIDNINNGDEIYFIRLIENSTYYSIQIDITQPMFSLAQASALVNNKPTYLAGGTWKFPTNREYCQVIFGSSSKLNEFLGFNIETLPTSITVPSGSTSGLTFLSRNTPITYPVSSVIVRCNMVYDTLSQPNDVLYSFTQGQSYYGDLISLEPNNIIWKRVLDGVYSHITLSFYDQNYNNFVIKDSQILITILIKDI
jgi:hypothetical protein